MLSLAAPLLGRLGAQGLRGLKSALRQRRPTDPRLPPGLDVDGFLAAARQHFVQLQAAWDAGDLQRLEHLTTGPLLAELREQVGARGDAVDRTDVVELQARLVAFEALGGALVASVEFSGLMREGSDAAVAGFRELWLLAKLDAGEGGAWRLAQVQSLG